MASVHPSHTPVWETVEHGWRAVVSPCGNGQRWTAHLEYHTSPQWRIWAGCLFQTIDQAKEWCSTEIHHQIRLSERKEQTKARACGA